MRRKKHVKLSPACAKVFRRARAVLPFGHGHHTLSNVREPFVEGTGRPTQAAWGNSPQ